MVRDTNGKYKKLLVRAKWGLYIDCTQPHEKRMVSSATVNLFGEKMAAGVSTSTKLPVFAKAFNDFLRKKHPGEAQSHAIEPRWPPLRQGKPPQRICRPAGGAIHYAVYAFMVKLD
jgi:hypothetical protein